MLMVTPLRPSLVPLESPDAYCAEMQGFSLRNVSLSAYEDGKLIFRELGEMLEFLMGYVMEFPENNRRDLLMSLAGGGSEE